MTFSFIPKRSSSEDDVLDRELNAWVSNERHSGRSEESWIGASLATGVRHSEGSLRFSPSARPWLAEESPREAQQFTTDALEFHRWADETLRTDPAATGPAAGTWDRVLRNTAQPTTEGNRMSSVTLSSAGTGTGGRGLLTPNRESISRFANLAASVLLVAAVAFAGWFTVSQLPGGGEGNGRFAAVSGTPEIAQSQICDVEPLSVDRVMEIVKNPSRFMINGAAGEPAQPENPDSPHLTALYEAGGWELTLSLQDPPQRPDDDVFETSSTFADAYLQCLVHGTLGQAWSFYSPVHIQQVVFSEFPVFRDEDTVRAWVEESLPAPARELNSMWGVAVQAYNPASASINPDPDLALQRQSSSGQFEYVVSLGVSFEDADGRTIFLTTGTGNELIRTYEGSNFNMTVSVANYRFSESWYIVPHWAP